MDDRVVLPVNTVLDNAYRIVRVVGSGGFGITYEAEDIKLNARIAIKEYYPCDFGMRDATMVVRPKSNRHKETFDWGRSNFLLEARTLARFEHASIVRVSRVFETNSTAYMVMRFEQGRSFEGWLQGLGRLPSQDELDAILVPLLEALEIMHSQKFLHRDIAPDNIIIRTDNTPVLLDFGAARRAVAERSRALTGIVKAGYSPQEQYASDGRLQGPWSDLYALGGTLYRAVTGTVPEEATLRVSDDRTRPAAAITKGDYRPGFLAAIDACLKVKYSSRPQSVAELRPMLFATSWPAAKPRPQAKPQTQTRPASLPKPSRRAEVGRTRGTGRPMVAIAAFLLLLGGAYGGYEYTRWAERDRVQKTEAQNAETKRQADADAAAKRKAGDDAQAAQAEARQKAELAAQAEAAAKRKADEEAAAARAAEAAAEAARRQDAAARKKTEEVEAARKAEEEKNARRQEEIAAAKRKTEEDRKKVEEEADRRKAEAAERDRRKQELASAALAFDGNWEITRVGSSCFTGPPIFGVTIQNGIFAQGFGSVSPAGEFKLQGRSKSIGPRDLHYVGNLAGTSGSGTFQADGGCAGTFTAKRR